jgi:glyoxylase-like metal-dependent hydrolase (beta-lactamase superfamily II)
MSAHAVRSPDDRLMVADTGANWGTALGTLADCVARAGYELSNLGLIILSHQRADHVGLAGPLARRTWAPVVCLDHLSGYLGGCAASAAPDLEVRSETLRSSCVDPERHERRSIRGNCSGTMDLR